LFGLSRFVCFYRFCRVSYEFLVFVKVPGLVSLGSCALRFWFWGFVGPSGSLRWGSSRVFLLRALALCFRVSFRGGSWLMVFGFLRHMFSERLIGSPY
jgi:hypothetical protein